VLATFHLVALTWVFFRASGSADALTILRGLFVGGGPVVSALDVWQPVVVLGLAIVTLLVLDVPQYRRRRDTAVLSWPLMARAAVIAFLTLSLLAVRQPRAEPFIYFQF